VGVELGRKIMARTGKVLLKVLLLPLAVAACLALQGTAKAQQQQCLDDLDPNWPPPPVTAPSLADRQAIMDLISNYNWARDEQLSAGLEDLFTDDVVYELCTAGGGIQVATVTGADEVGTYLGSLTTFLNTLKLRTRHLVSNTILDVVDTNTVQGKTTVLVLLQSAFLESPLVDYTATLKAEYRRVNGAWRFGRLTLIGDTPAPGPGGARGR
jgi:SnoaL-like domain